LGGGGTSAETGAARCSNGSSGSGSTAGGGGGQGSCGIVATSETVIGATPGVVGKGGGGGATHVAPTAAACVAFNTIGGFGPAAVKAGKKSAAVGVSASPLANSG
jgi:hypothetical protein